jgi:Secretion system C-terminal sorting domain
MMNLLTKFGVFALILLVASSAFADGTSSPIQVNANKTVAGDGTIVANSVEGPYSTSGLTLDEPQVGDTLTIGYTWRDMQHNGSIGRMIAMADDVDGNLTAHFIWCGREGVAERSETRYNRVYYADTDEWEYDRYNGDNIEGFSGFGGYTVIEADPATNRPFAGFHGQATGSEVYLSRVNSESTFLPFMFLPNYDLPTETGLQVMWPHMSFDQVGEHKYLHILANPQDDTDNETNFYYIRTEYTATNEFINATPNSDVAILVTENAMNLSSVPVASPYGDKVALGGTIGRWLLRGRLPADWDGLALSQSDNDIYVWESADGGDTWDFNSPVNVTNFLHIDESYLPSDTTSANQDTLRAYTEVSMAYDTDETLHLAFNVHGFDYLRGSVYRSSKIYYWNNVAEEYVMIADADFWNYTQPVSWERIGGHASISYEEENDVIWVMYQQYGEAGDTNDAGEALDGNAAGFANADLYMTASFDGGHRFMKGVNVTNTRTMEPGLAPGDSRGEREPSMARHAEGGYLHLTYTIDFDPGVACPAGSTVEGEATQNLQVYHRVSKAAMIDSFLTRATYLPNYPLHIDSTGFYEDPNGWAWDSPTLPDYAVGVDENPNGNTLTPDEFTLAQNYPNPFNPSTEIAFNLQKAGVVNLAVYDILGREIAQLVNRQMNAGDHKVSFLANDLSSGVYFYKLTSGDASQIRKMVLMK